MTVLISQSNIPDNRQCDDALVQRCVEAGYQVVVVPHLYHLPEDSAVWQDIAAMTDLQAVLGWLHPRPLEWLLKRHKIINQHPVFLNIGSFEDAETCFAALTSQIPFPEGDSEGTLWKINAETAERWYPVTDRSRCNNCRHCLQFCLFGVYELDEQGAVMVQRPDQCKPGCPACSRVCPQGAIIFPLYAKDDAIAGAPDRYMTPDVSARRMYYLRTQIPCTICGRIVDRAAGLQPAGDDCCSECGQAVTTTRDEVIDAELDDLIGELDSLAQRRP
ncbi:MAG: ATP-binding protein [Armatimonadota bacterium]